MGQRLIPHTLSNHRLFQGLCVLAHQTSPKHSLDRSGLGPRAIRKILLFFFPQLRILNGQCPLSGGLEAEPPASPRRSLAYSSSAQRSQMPLPRSAHSSHICVPHRPHMRMARASPLLPHIKHSTTRNTSDGMSMPRTRGIHTKNGAEIIPDPPWPPRRRARRAARYRAAGGARGGRRPAFSGTHGAG